MKQLRLTHIIRGIVIPIVVAVVFTAAIFALEPFMESAMQTNYSAAVSQKNEYEKVKYNSFKELKTDNAVGFLSSGEFEFSTNVLYNTTKAKYSTLSKLSTEPWNGGCVVVYGSNVRTQLGYLENAQVGNKVTFDFYNQDKYTYKITKILNNQTDEDIKALRKDNALLMCVAYNDFSNLGSSYFYTVYVAEMV